eukprot:TRINITY_DN72165_c0_g1_i1.p1 TRINITY_DN72165_c0_g1~~TRINITY_DN72165_c0_g1_i1.p1  ORF type:complete len:283 (+),score=45.94 TRINITY_DN72165_c0_g1_i1:156-1004(+)
MDSSSYRLRTWTNNLAASLLAGLDQKGLRGICLRTTLFLSLVGATAAAGSGLLLCYLNVHIRFWLGDLPIVCLAPCTAALALLSFVLLYQIFLYSHRRAQQEKKWIVNLVDKDFSMRLSRHTLRLLFVTIVATSLAAAVLGYFVVVSGHEMSVSLMKECGKSGNTKSIQNMHQRLEDFAQSHKCSASKSLDSCNGYSKVFPSPAPFASYLKVLELEKDCGGFCSYKAPLFNVSPDKSVKQEACAKKMGRRLLSITYVIGVPAMVGGVLFSMLGCLLLCYDGI